MMLRLMEWKIVFFNILLIVTHQERNQTVELTFTNTLQRCYFHQETMKIVCLDTAYSLIFMDVREEEISRKESFVLSANDVNLNRKFFINADCTEILFMHISKFTIYQALESEFTIKQ